MKQKGKIIPISARRFVGLWVAMQLILYVLNAISRDALFPDPTAYGVALYTIVYAPIGWLFTLVIATLEFRLLRRFLRQTPRYWVQARMALAVFSTISFLMLYFLPTERFVPAFNGLAFNVVLYLPILLLALTQWSILRRYTRFAWLWIAAAMGSFAVQQAVVHWITFNMPYPSTEATFLSYAQIVVRTFIAPLAVVLMVMLSGRQEDNERIQQSDIQSDYLRLVDDASDPQADKAPLVQRRAQSY